MEKAQQLYFRQVGTGPKALVVLHGIFGSGDNWMTVAKLFDPAYTVYLLDQRNHGRSFQDDEFSYAAIVQDLADWLDQQGLKHPVILGHSMGGKVLMHFLGQYPDWAKAAIIVDIAPRAYQIHHQTIVDGLTALDLLTATTRNDIDARLAAYVPEQDTRQFLMKNVYRNEDGKFALRINLPVIAANLDMVGAALDENILWLGPILFIRGANSNYVRDEDLPELRHHFPNAEVKTINYASHWVQAEQPEAFAQALNTFLASVNVN